MNYQHGYHAGNFAEIFKHFVLFRLLNSLIKKEKPFFYLDTHAGSALYDLHGSQAQKTLEYQQGIAKLWKQKSLAPLVSSYIDLIKQYNPDKTLRFYPGSPCIAKSFLREQDRMICIDQHPTVYQTLKKFFIDKKQILIKEEDGYQALKAFLPPKERRGLVFIDPPYEDSDEFSILINHLKNAYKRWPTGIYAVWYPIKDRNRVEIFYNNLMKSSISNILITELSLMPDDVPQRLNGSGMIIVNPPWKIDTELQEALPILLEYLRIDKKLGEAKVYFLRD